MNSHAYQIILSTISYQEKGNSTSEKGHGRLETRSLICGATHIEDVDWPGVAQVIRRECKRIELKTGKLTHKVSYGLTSLALSQADAAVLEAPWRGQSIVHISIQPNQSGFG